MEFVFVVPRAELFPSHYPHGLVPFGSDSEEHAFQRCIEQQGFFVERDYAEKTPSLKQIIPYTVVVRGEEVFLLKRTKKGGETRLHDKLSIGVGGHVNPIDRTRSEEQSVEIQREESPKDSPRTARRSTSVDRADESARNPILAATRREVLDEELDVDGQHTLHAVGLLNDDSNAVGAVHLGLVQVLVVEGRVRVRETDQLEGSFVPIAELHRMLGTGANFETWSSLLVPHLDRLIPQLVHP